MARPITWIHTADLHLDQPVTSWYGCTQKAAQRREDYRKTFNRIISLVKQKNVRFLFIAGDFLEHGYIQASTVDFVRDCFRTIPNTVVLIAPGNHDPNRHDSFYYSKEDWPSNVHIFSEQWESIRFSDYDLTIYGRGFSDYIEPNWIPLPEVAPGGNHILITHGTFIPSSNQGSKESYFPIFEKELTRYPFDYVALGHNHKSSLFELKNQRRTQVCYPGSPEALSWKETGDRFIVYGTLDRNRIDIEWIPIHSRTYEQVFCDVSICATREELAQLIQRELHHFNNDSCFQIVLEGRYSFNVEEEYFWLKEYVRSCDLFHFEIVNRTKPDFDLSFYRNQKGAMGLFVRKMEERIAQNPKQKKEYEMALYKGLEALCAAKK